MPRGDRTGPYGMGPMSGRSAGYCAGFAMPGYENFIQPGFGRMRQRRGCGYGFGFMKQFGRGFGRGFSKGFDEKEILKQQAHSLQSELEFIQNRLSQLETNAAQNSK